MNPEALHNEILSPSFEHPYVIRARGGITSSPRRRFIRNMGLGLAAAGIAAERLAARPDGAAGGLEKLFAANPAQPAQVPLRFRFRWSIPT